MKKLLIFLALLLPILHAHAAPAKRVALLIGNGEYEHESRLKNPERDAALLGGVLQNELGFSDVQVKKDLKYLDMKKALLRFAADAKGADVVVFYFSGHGIQSYRRNFLLGKDAHTSASQPEELEVQGLMADEVREKLKTIGARVTLIILDACRDGPGIGKSGKKGLAYESGEQGVLVAYATDDGNIAQDGKGENSPYAGALAQALRRTDLSVLRQLDWVAREVRKAVPGQKPMKSGDLEADEFLVPENKPKLLDAEPAAWQVCIQGSTAEACAAYERDFPNGPRIVQARTRKADLQAGRSAGLTTQPDALPTAKPSAIKPGQTIKDCDICPELVLVPGGQFVMGDDKSQNPDEKPAHRVTVPAFFMGKTEVTQGQWQAVMGSNPSNFKKCGASCPVENVSWEDVQGFVQKLSARTGKSWRLPSEAEWEYAARAGSTSSYPWGEQVSHEFANYGKDECCSGFASGRDKWIDIAPVASFAANAFGLHDMHGNVLEWVEDCWHGNYNNAPNNGSAWVNGCDKSVTRMLRSSSWNDTPDNLRSAVRLYFDPASHNAYFGFRVARTLP